MRPRGRDATVSWGGPDLVFKNDLDHAILITTSYTSSTLTFSFYGTPQGRRIVSTTGPKVNWRSPTMSYAFDPGAQYQRQSIRTKNPAYSWVGASDPVTYSFTIGNYPGRTYSGFQTHLFIVPGSNLPTYETSPDWNEPNVIFLQIANNADGTAYGAFRYKTNQPSGNSMIFGNGTIATIGSASALGTAQNQMFFRACHRHK